VTRLGTRDASASKKLQFHGAVSNIRIFFLDSSNQIEALSKTPCDSKVGDYMQWADMTWETTGTGVRETASRWSVCHEHETVRASLAITLGLTQLAAVKICKLLGGHLIHASNQSELAKLVSRFDTPVPGRCQYIWTPYSDAKDEGSFTSLVDGSALEYKPWMEGQPNGQRLENSITINAESGLTPYVDVSEDEKGCASCNISLGLVLRLRGACASTLLGKFNTHTVYAVGSGTKIIMVQQCNVFLSRHNIFCVQC
jgi:hypothetical protein